MSRPNWGENANKGLSHPADPYDMVIDVGYGMIVVLRGRRCFSGERNNCWYIVFHAPLISLVLRLLIALHPEPQFHCTAVSRNCLAFQVPDIVNKIEGEHAASPLVIICSHDVFSSVQDSSRFLAFYAGSLRPLA